MTTFERMILGTVLTGLASAVWWLMLTVNVNGNRITAIEQRLVQVDIYRIEMQNDLREHRNRTENLKDSSH